QPVNPLPSSLRPSSEAQLSTWRGQDSILQIHLALSRIFKPMFHHNNIPTQAYVRLYSYHRWSHHKPLTLFSAVTLTSLASPPWILPPSLQTRDLFRCHHWFSFTPSGATTVPCLDRSLW
ncbi:hypothetical protein HN51_034099, partial [Arachis hypogaea]